MLITDEQIEALEQEAAEAGDESMVADCQMARAGDAAARVRVMQALAEARAAGEKP